MHKNNFPFCCPIALHLRLLLNRGILTVEQLRFRIRSIVATKFAAHLTIKIRKFILCIVLIHFPYCRAP